MFHGDTYCHGFLEKDIKIHGIITENINPTLDKVTTFQAAENLEQSYDSQLAALPPVDPSVIANAARKAVSGNVPAPTSFQLILTMPNTPFPDPDMRH